MLYQELGLESLQNRLWFRKLSVFYKIVKKQSPKYVYDLILKTTFNTKEEIAEIW